MEDKQRLEALKWVNAARPLTREEVHWLIEKAEEVEDQRFLISELECEKQLLYGRLNNLSDLLHKKIK